LDGDFTYCSRKLCPALTERLLPKRSEITEPRLRDIIDNHRTVIDAPPQKLTLGHDPSCNLACPSCRNEVQVIKNEERERLDKITDQIVLPLMDGVPVSLILSTDGDPIGSKHFRRLIHSLDAVRHSKVRLMLITNGLLMTQREWESLGHVQELIAFIGVSIDAAEAETYEDLRRPGKWATIVANMDFLAELRRQGRLPHLGLQFVVQKKNFEQMPGFVALGRKWGADTIRFIRLTNIGSFSGPDFEENDVCDPRHPLHHRLIGILRDPCFRDPRVSMFTMTPLWDEANRLPQGSAA
jgi:MoaA/NifB/PqqE/SkfB family radical SAM enzyme